MEAPTPVSALLHAGVVNLGGFVLLRFAPVVDRAVETRALLIIVGTATAVIAALVMTTRVSVKVSLAWSTCAQMGFMLMQCGLGIWEMALLHLVAHSLYKAHAFLGAGGAVRHTQRQQLVPRRATSTGASLLVDTTVVVTCTYAAGWAWGRLPFADPPSATIWLLIGIVAVALVPLAGELHNPGRTRLRLIAGTTAVPLAYFALHDITGRLVPHGPTPPPALLVFVAISFALLFAANALCVLASPSGLSARLYPWLYGGLFLDEAFTRVTFALWPPPAPRSRPPVLPLVATTPFPDRTHA